MDVLVSMPLDGARAGVVRASDGSLWLTDDVRKPMTGLSDFRPGIMGLLGDRTLIGGALPPGAVSAEVVDDRGDRHAAAVGGGAWVLVLDQPADGSESPVWFRDANGIAVRPPLPANWPRAPVDDAGEPCPACGCTSWEQVTPDDDSRGMHGMPGTGWSPTPFLVCTRCGYEEPIGVFFGGEGPDVDVEAADPDPWHELAGAQALRDARFPVIAMARAESRVAGWGSSSDHRVSSITLTHDFGAAGWLRIETAIEDDFERSPTSVARDALQHAAFDAAGAWPDASEGAAGLWIAQRGREARRRAARAEVESVDLLVDGVTTTFDCVRDGELWAAGHRDGTRTIAIAGNRVDPTSLELAALSAGR